MKEFVERISVLNMEIESWARKNFIQKLLLKNKVNEDYIQDKLKSIFSSGFEEVDSVGDLSVYMKIFLSLKDSLGNNSKIIILERIITSNYFDGINPKVRGMFQELLQLNKQRKHHMNNINDLLS